MLDVGLHLRDREIIGVDQALLQLEHLVLRVEIAFVPRHVALKKCVGELAAFELVAP